MLTGPEPKRRRKRLRLKGRRGFWAQSRKLFWSWWLWATIALILASGSSWGAAIGTGLWAILVYLVHPQEQSPKYGLTSEFPVQSDEFLSSITGSTGVHFMRGNELTILNNGIEFFPKMLEAIEKARQSITIEAYIYWAGDIGSRFARALAAKSREGIEVKVLLDAVGSSTIGKEILETLQSGGCRIEWYNPVRWDTIGRFNHRTHRKSLVIDGRIAFTGGAGIADHWMGNAEGPEHWRDIQIQIAGPAAIPLQTGFAQNWLSTTGELISGATYFPAVEPAGSMEAQTILSSPEMGSSAVRIMYYLSIVCAKKSIYIANPYFIPDEAAVDILVDAKRRGVDVKIMVAGIHNDMRLARYAGIRLYGNFLKAGIEIYEYNKTMLHQKTMVVDGAWITVGTTNFDNRSFALNEESNVCLHDSGIARKLETIFFDDLKACDRIDLETWKRRGIMTKIQGMVACFLKEQI